MKKRGFALATVLVLMVAIFVMGIGAMYMSEMGFRSISAESMWHKAEKAANAGIMLAGQRATDPNSGCSQAGGTHNIGGVSVDVRTINAGGACFIWSSATVGNTKVVKVALLTEGNPAGNMGAVVIRNLTNLSLGGSGAITSCDPNCRTSAVVIGNSLNNPPSENQVTTCPNNPKGVTALVDPLVVKDELRNTDITNIIFNNINDRNGLLNTLSTNFRVSFNDGTPNGIVGNMVNITDDNGGLLANAINTVNPPNYDVCAANYNNCTASENTIRCTGNNNLNFVWTGNRYEVKTQSNITLQFGGSTVVIPANTTVASCSAVDFGSNATLTVNGFNGGGPVASGQLKLSGGASNATFIVRQTTTDESNNINITNVNVNLFSKNITLDNNKLNWEGGVLYSGGAGVGNFDINLNSNSKLGFTNNPVLIITDNNMNIQRNGNAEINGLIFATSANNNLSIGSGNGNFSINGAVISNSTNNNNINISGNFSINFNKGILDKLAQKFNFLKPPQCGGAPSVKVPFIQTKMTVY